MEVIMSVDEPLDGPTRDLLVRLDERFSMVVGSVREVKEELHALRKDLRDGDEALKNELKKEIREKLAVLTDRIESVEKRVLCLETDVGRLQQNAAAGKGGRDTITLLIAVAGVLIAFAALLI